MFARSAQALSPELTKEREKMRDKTTLFNNLHQGDVKIDGKNHKFWYIGDGQEFKNLVKEIFEQKSYAGSVKKTDKVILDLGAYVGMTAYCFAQLAEKVYAVEPNNEAFEALGRNLKANGLEDRVIPIKAAIAARTGKSRLYCMKGNEVGASLIPFTPDKRGFDIETMSIDKLFEDYGIEHVDLMKMDIEGAEYEILESEGFAGVADKIDRIIMEVHPYTKAGATGGEVWKIPYLLRQHGFDCWRAPGSDNWNVLLNFSDGHKKWVPMLVLMAERQK